MCNWLSHKSNLDKQGCTYYLLSLGTFLVMGITFWIPFSLFRRMEMEEFYPDELENLQEQYKVWREPFFIELEGILGDGSCNEGFESILDGQACAKRGS